MAFAITSPHDNERVQSDPIQVTGVGADPAGRLEVTVFSNKPWPQNGTASINANGTWTYSPCYVSGEGIYNKHTITVTLVMNGQRVATASVHGVVRQ